MTRRDPNTKAQLSRLKDSDEAGFDCILFNNKRKIDCICPKCGKKHALVFNWIGRGIPRKYCPACKGRHDD